MSWGQIRRDKVDDAAALILIYILIKVNVINYKIVMKVSLINMSGMNPKKIKLRLKHSFDSMNKDLKELKLKQFKSVTRKNSNDSL